MTAMMANSSISRWSGALGVCAIVAIIRPAHADPRAVVELFTSQGCSSCPPANAVLNGLADRPDLLALSFAVTYWDQLGWKDKFGSPRFTARQRDYAAAGRGQVATPYFAASTARRSRGSRSFCAQT